MNDLTNGASAVSEATAIGFYLVYAFIAVGLVAFLAHTLSRNGRVFLEETFERPELAASVNQLLVIGFYLLNLGYALMVYQLHTSYGSLIDAFNHLVGRTALLLVSLGVIHLVNMWIFWRIRIRATAERRRVELPPPTPQPPAPYAPVPAGSPLLRPTEASGASPVEG